MFVVANSNCRTLRAATLREARAKPELLNKAEMILDQSGPAGGVFLARRLQGATIEPLTLC